MIGIRILFAVVALISVLGCKAKEQRSRPHPSATLLAGVTGYLEACRLLIADPSVTQKDAIEFGPVGLSFAHDTSTPADTPPETVALLSRRQAALETCVHDLNKSVGIKAAR